jgi:hypothetical protein
LRRKDEETVKQEKRLKDIEESMASFKEKMVALCGQDLSFGDRVGAIEKTMGQHEERLVAMDGQVAELQVTFLGLRMWFTINPGMV